MTVTRSERAVLSPSDRASRDRRIARAVKYGVTYQDIKRRFQITDRTIRDICQRYGVAIPKGGPRL
jgi:hypothetical protein